MVYEVTESKFNKDIIHGLDKKQSKEYYMKMYGDFKSKLPAPDFYPCPERPDIFILDFAKGPCGLKAYGAEKLIATIDSDMIGYAAPRVGHAAEAIAMLSEMYNKRAIFFAAASKEVTPHQAVVLAYKKCHLRFARIPAMPTLNAWIRKWAMDFGAIALPFGLSNTPLLTAGLVNMCEEHAIINGEPNEFYCAVSTGTMIRALQIGWPNAKAVGVAVARNLKLGEKGNAKVISYHKSFYQKSDYTPPFATTATYDAKAYKLFIEQASPGAIFINVGSDEQIEKRLINIPRWKEINSRREWGDLGDFTYE